MTRIEISDSKQNLEELNPLLEDYFKQKSILHKIEIYDLHLDSIDVDTLLTTLQVTFTGVIALKNLVDLVLNFKKRNSRNNNEKKASAYIKIETNNGKQLNLEISRNIEDQDIKQFLSKTEELVDEFSASDEFSLNLTGSKSLLNSNNMEKINYLFTVLLNTLIDIRVLDSLPPRQEQDLIIHSFTFEKIPLAKIIKNYPQAEKFFLNTKEANSCKKVFSILERENILFFQEDCYDVRLIREAARIINDKVDPDSISFVGYTLTRLSLFEKIISDKHFILS